MDSLTFSSKETIMLSALLTLLGIGIVGVIVVIVAMAVLGAIFGLAAGLFGLLFKLLPLLLVGWVVLKLLERRGKSNRRISAEDQRWLDGG
ncbi:hypothetical protein BH20GEM2_BH20GEM2_15750 [soil metagenome]